MSKSQAPMVAFVAVGGFSLVPVVGMFGLAPLAAVVLGGAVAWSAAKATGSAGQGTSAALAVGLGALLGTVAFLALAATVLGVDPAVQEFVRLSEPHPEARIPYEWIAPLATATGALVGLLLGIGYLVLAVVSGLVVSLFAPQGCAQSGRTV